MTEIPSPTWADDLPVPLSALLELGMTLEQIEQAHQSKPLTVACQASKAEGAFVDVDRV
jgi:hypothetical protein